MDNEAVEKKEVANPFPAVRQQMAVSESVVQREVAEVQAMVVSAKRFPRDPVAAMARIENACSRPTLAEGAFYQYAKGGTDIDGPSIRLAEVLAQNWGNMVAGVTILGGDSQKSECIAYAWDLETGFRDEKRFTVKHWRDRKNGQGYIITDERDIYELAANMGARRKRACILAVIPGDVIEYATAKCHETLATAIKITPEFIERLVTSFANIGVTKQQLEAYIQRPVDTLTPVLAQRLKKIGTSIKDGVGKPEDWFEVAAGEGVAPTKGVEAVKERARKARAAVAPAAQPNATGDGKTTETEASLSLAKSQPVAGAPEPLTDEAAALLAMDRAQDDGEASMVIDRCKGQPWRNKIVAAYNERFSKVIG